MFFSSLPPRVVKELSTQRLSTSLEPRLLMIRIQQKSIHFCIALCRIIVLINSIIFSISAVVEAERAIHFRIALCRGCWLYHVSDLKWPKLKIVHAHTTTRKKTEHSKNFRIEKDYGSTKSQRDGAGE